MCDDHTPSLCRECRLPLPLVLWTFHWAEPRPALLPQNHVPSLVPRNNTEGARSRSSQQKSGHRSEARLEEPGCRPLCWEELMKWEGCSHRLSLDQAGEAGRRHSFIHWFHSPHLLNTCCVTGTIVGAGVMNRGFGARWTEFTFQLQPWASHLSSLRFSTLISTMRTVEPPAH